jgi:hypothetical protein
MINFFQRRNSNVVVSDDAVGVVHQPVDVIHSGLRSLASKVPAHRSNDRRP